MTGEPFFCVVLRVNREWTIEAEWPDGTTEIVETFADYFEALVRLQMVWDNLSCLGTEALARLGLRLGGFQLMFQSSLSDGVAFDPFSFQKDGSASAEVDVGRCQVL